MLVVFLQRDALRARGETGIEPTSIRNRSLCGPGYRGRRSTLRSADSVRLRKTVGTVSFAASIFSRFCPWLWRYEPCFGAVFGGGGCSAGTTISGGLECPLQARVIT